ncbi:hypothetical protein F2Q70_00019475 [Brassica cretica]|uniref:Uncharacterized protein n=1 Tax=Brassica cretica TaxID=69181 RepID=A0A8S9GL00_BRACR|nr:hypothetical protein F2Q70_00019475 [Brassica cretica]
MRKPKTKNKVKIFAKGRVLRSAVITLSMRESLKLLHMYLLIITSTRSTPLVPSSNDSLQPASPVASSPVFNPIIHTPTVHNSSDHNTHPVSTHLLNTSAPVVTSPCLSRNHTSSSFGHSDDHHYDSPTVLVLHLSSRPPMTRHNLLLLSLAPLFSTLSFTHRLSTIPVTTTHPVSTHLLTIVAPVVTSSCLSRNHTSSSSGHSDDHHY